MERMERMKFRLIEKGGLRTLAQKKIVGIAQSRSPFWDDFIKTNPLAESRWYNALLGWLTGSYPEEFEIDLTT